MWFRRACFLKHREQLLVAFFQVLWENTFWVLPKGKTANQQQHRLVIQRGALHQQSGLWYERTSAGVCCLLQTVPSLREKEPSFGQTLTASHSFALVFGWGERKKTKKKDIVKQIVGEHFCVSAKDFCHVRNAP